MTWLRDLPPKVEELGETNQASLDFSTLFADPQHQGRGAATLLLRRSIEHAAETGLAVYLDASAAAHGLYLKHRFRDVEVMETDFSKWGLAEPVRTWAMIKEL